MVCRNEIKYCLCPDFEKRMDDVIDRLSLSVMKGDIDDILDSYRSDVVKEGRRLLNKGGKES